MSSVSVSCREIPMYKILRIEQKENIYHRFLLRLVSYFFDLLLIHKVLQYNPFDKMKDFTWFSLSC